MRERSVTDFAHCRAISTWKSRIVACQECSLPGLRPFHRTGVSTTNGGEEIFSHYAWLSVLWHQSRIMKKRILQSDRSVKAIKESALLFSSIYQSGVIFSLVELLCLFESPCFLASLIDEKALSDQRVRRSSSLRSSESGLSFACRQVLLLLPFQSEWPFFLISSSFFLSFPFPLLVCRAHK